jgi:hypothetical protein
MASAQPRDAGLQNLALRFLIRDPKMQDNKT